MSRDDIVRGANPASDNPREHAPENEQGGDNDAILSGDSDRRGIGLAAGLCSTTFLSGAGDDPYAAYDTGMAGCTVEPTSCPIPGMPQMGHFQIIVSNRPSELSEVLVPISWISHGYERDAEEYASVLDLELEKAPMIANAREIGGEGEGGTDERKGGTDERGGESERGEGKDEDGGSEGAEANVSLSEGTGESAGRQDENNHHAKPSIGSRIVGRVERLAGKVFRDPEIEARGMRHITGHP